MKYLIYSILSIFLSGCTLMQTPVDFTYRYDAQPTGLDTLINIDGYYTLQRGCDSRFHAILMFYPDGLFAIATTQNKPQELFDCFEKGGDSKICNYMSWGVYRMEGNIIRTQAVRNEGIGKCTILRDYRIESDESIVNLSDYVNPENTQLGYMKNYPSFKENNCPTIATFTSTKAKRDPKECPVLKMKWFRK